MRIDELVDANAAAALLEAKRPSPEDLIRLVKEVAPEVMELWLYGARASDKARKGDPWTFVAVISDEVNPQRRVEISHALATLRYALPGMVLDFIVCRNHDRIQDFSPLYWAQRGEGKKVWRNRSAEKIA